MGKYLLEECLGVGGMGDVYRATNVALGRKVAIKLLASEYVHIEGDVLRFLREARAAATIRHPNVVDVFDVARDEDGAPFIVQELLAGEDLERHLRARRRLSCEEALELMVAVADGVAAAHAEDVVHRDLKPANIFLARVRDETVPKVLDFGACLFPTIAERSAKEARMLIGTPHYMAPEQIVSKAEVDARSDVWALGVILFEMLVGETPFEAENADAVMELVKTREIPPLRTRAEEAPVELEALIARCTARDRLARPRDARELHEELAAISRGMRALPPSPRRAAEAAPEPPLLGASAHEAAPAPVRIPSLDRLPAIPRGPRGGGRTSSSPPANPTMSFDVPSAPADLVFAARPSSWPPEAYGERPRQARSSLPAVLDPSATRRVGSEPPPSAGPRAASGREAPSSRGRGSRWSPRAAATLIASIALPAAAGVAAVLGVPALGAPLGRALRGDATLASGVLAIVALTGAAWLCGRCLLRDADGLLRAAAAGAVLFGVAMIIVTFSASEAAELGVPPAMAGLSSAVGPLAPLALGLRALWRARGAWLDPYARGAALRSAALASALFVLAVALSPLGPSRTPPASPAETGAAGR